MLLQRNNIYFSNNQYSSTINRYTTMTHRELLISNSVSFGMSLGFGVTDRVSQAATLKQFDLLIKMIGMYQRSKPGNQSISEHAIENLSAKMNVLVTFDTHTRTITLHAKFPYGFEPELQFPSVVINDNNTPATVAQPEASQQ